MRTIFLIMIGGAVGTLLRYLISVGMKESLGSGFPFGTMAVNITGCLAIGVLGYMFAFRPGWQSDEMQPYRLAIMIGLLGGFTTFSSFGYETFQLLKDQQITKVVLNVAISNCLGLLAVWAGYTFADKMLFGQG
jgi:fluoride exporter